MADDLKNGGLANDSQVAKNSDTVDATDMRPSESIYESSVEEEKEPEESSGNLIGKIVVKASVMEEKRIAKCSNNINDEEGISPEKASIGETGSRSACNVYGENKYNVKNHKAQKKKKRCYICGDTRHEGKACKMVNACLFCSKKGHLAINCPNKNVEVDFTSILCLKCGNNGHDMSTCTNDYDHEDLKAIRCFICKKVGHLCCVDRKPEGSAEPSCYNCGELGHLGLVCTKEKNVVADDPEAVCGKCKKRGHYKRSCPEKLNARMAKRNRSGITYPTITYPSSLVNLYQSQPSGSSRPPIVGPHYGSPGSNNPNYQVGSLPSHQDIDHYHHQLGMQVLNAFGHYARYPHDPYWNFQNRPQTPQMPLNQEARNVVPQTGSVRQPMVQLPSILQPNVNPNQRGIMLPHTQPRIPQSPMVLPAQHPNIIQNNPRQPFSQQTLIVPHSAGTHIPQQSVSRLTVIVPPSAGTYIPQQSVSRQTVFVPHSSGTHIPQQFVSRQTVIVPPLAGTYIPQQSVSRQTVIVPHSAGTRIPQQPVNRPTGIMHPYHA